MSALMKLAALGWGGGAASSPGGSTGGATSYSNDVFNTTCYTGNGTMQTVTTGLDLAPAQAGYATVSPTPPGQPFLFTDSVGTLYSFSNNELVKYGSPGWKVIITPIYYLQCQSACVDSNGYVTVAYRDSSGSNQIMRIIRFDANGTRVWDRYFTNGGNAITPYDIGVLNNGDLVICGQYNDGTKNYGFLMTVNPANGGPSSVYGASSPYDVAYYTLTIDSSGYVYVAGYSSDSNGAAYAMYDRINPYTGARIGQRAQFRVDGDTLVDAIALDPSNGDVYLLATCATMQAYALTKFDTNGTKQWSYKFTGIGANGSTSYSMGLAVGSYISVMFYDTSNSTHHYFTLTKSMTLINSATGSSVGGTVNAGSLVLNNGTLYMNKGTDIYRFQESDVGVSSTHPLGSSSPVVFASATGYAAITPAFTNITPNLGGGNITSGITAPTVAAANYSWSSTAGKAAADGMMLIKHRGPGSPGNTGFNVIDTLNGIKSQVRADGNAVRTTNAAMLAFTASGFSMNHSLNTAGTLNQASEKYVAWTFKKTSKFFDLLRYAGNGSSTQTVNHNLGVKPGMILTKWDGSGNWYVYHRGTGQYRLGIGATGATADSTTINGMNGSSVPAYQVGAGGGGAGYYGGNGGNGGIGAGGGGGAGYSGSQLGGKGGDGAVIINYGNTTVVFTSGGNQYTWTPPSGVTSFKVWVIGAGGGGAGSSASDANSGGGGAAGGIAYKVYYTVAGVSASIAIGSGGTGGFDASDGSSGQGSSFSYNSININASGGSGGRWNAGQTSSGGSGGGQADAVGFGGSGGSALGDQGGGGGGGLNNVPGANPTSAGGKGATPTDFQGLAAALAYSGEFNPNGALLWNSTSAIVSASWGAYTAVDDKKFSVSSLLTTSGNGFTSYIFGHDDDRVNGQIHCGAYTGSGAAGLLVDIGWEPQFLMVKNISGAGEWHIVDWVRGFPTAAGQGPRAVSIPNSVVEQTLQYFAPNPVGFTVETTNSAFNALNQSYIFMAIRRPSKKPTAGTDVLFISAAGATTYGAPSWDYADVALVTGDRFGGSLPSRFYDRMRGVPDPVFGGSTPYLSVNQISSEQLVAVASSVGMTTTPSAFTSDNALGGAPGGGNVPYSGYAVYLLKRAPGFMDVVAYTGDGASQTYRKHGLGVRPELVIAKARNSTSNWQVYFDDGQAVYPFYLNTNGAVFSGGTGWTTDTDFITHNNGALSYNQANVKYIAYLFASLAGVSKIGEYTGSGGSMSIDCGFSNGARFVLIKRHDSSGYWWLFDTARGIVASSDPATALNSTLQEVSYDAIDPYPPGFIINSGGTPSLCELDARYRYLAIA